MIKKGSDIEVINIYRELHSVGLAEAKQAVEYLEVKVG